MTTLPKLLNLHLEGFQELSPGFMVRNLTHVNASLQALDPRCSNSLHVGP